MILGTCQDSVTFDTAHQFYIEILDTFEFSEILFRVLKVVPCKALELSVAATVCKILNTCFARYLKKSKMKSDNGLQFEDVLTDSRAFYNASAS